MKKLRRIKAIDKATAQLAVADLKGDTVNTAAIVRKLFGLVEEVSKQCQEERQLNADAAAFMLCVKHDVPAPLSFYKAWGGYQYVRKLAIRDGVLDWAAVGAVKQGKCIFIRPSDWAKLIKSKFPEFKLPNHV